MEKKVMTVKELAEVMQCSLPTAYDLTEQAGFPIVMDLPMAARIVGQTPEYLKKRAQRGTFPAYKEGNQWRISKDALIKLI